jgi:hypothetical protein
MDEMMRRTNLLVIDTIKRTTFMIQTPLAIDDAERISEYVTVIYFE